MVVETTRGVMVIEIVDIRLIDHVVVEVDMVIEAEVVLQ
jgi:hypothetical protein